MGELCRACVSAGYGKAAGMMHWYEKGLQGIVPAKLFRSKGGMWKLGTRLKTTSMRMGVESAEDQYQRLCNRH